MTRQSAVLRTVEEYAGVHGSLRFQSIRYIIHLEGISYDLIPTMHLTHVESIEVMSRCRFCDQSSASMNMEQPKLTPRETELKGISEEFVPQVAFVCRIEPTAPLN